jgi:hypothetical protein
MTCKYCKLAAQLADSLSPCACAGSIALVHRTCLLNWLSVKQQQPLWRCEMCHADIRYTFSAQSLLPAVRASLHLLSPEHLYVLCTAPCVCQRETCECRGLFPWSKRTINLALMPQVFGIILWLAFKFSSPGSLSVDLCRCCDLFSLLFAWWSIGVDLVASTMEQARLAGPLSVFLLVNVWLVHLAWPFPCGTRFAFAWLLAVGVVLASSLRYMTLSATREFHRTRLQVEARHVAASDK